MNELFLVALLAVIGLAACSSKEEPAVMTAPPAASAAAPNTGKILQLMQAAGYTYAEVESNGGQRVWMAGAPLQLKAGDRVQWGEYAVMRNFTSKVLSRTFEQILFVNTWGQPGGVTAQVAPHGTPPPANQTPSAFQLSPGQETTSASANQGQVKSVSVAGGYTYLEIDQNGAAVWIAAPKITVKAGDNVKWNGGAIMQNFVAKTLGRTFDQIIFVGSVAVVQ